VARHRFAILVPAHDEARLIGATVDSLTALDYPAGLASVHVVADNCADATAAIARTHGAEAHERHDPEHAGKGPALMWLLGRLEQRGDQYDAAVIVDADTIVSTNFLRVMDAKLQTGAQAAQAYYAVRDAEASPLAAFRAAALAARHFLRPLGRTALGGSAGLYGNGMTFRAEVFRRHRWSDHLTEDIELQLELLLEGHPIAFAPDAIVEAEMPTSIDASRSQHERWERGRLEIARRFLPQLVRQAMGAPGPRRLAATDAAFDQLMPPFSVLVAATAAWAMAMTIRAAASPGRRARGVAPVVAPVVVVLTVQAAYVLSALKMVSAPMAVYRSLLGAPRLVIWKVHLWLRMLMRRREVEWVRTARNRSSSADATGDRASA
jgi:cellulose synthase/poly-beta-1,6-N-acetylglucosamine synthase-like glycosyltransferase